MVCNRQPCRECFFENITSQSPCGAGSPTRGAFLNITLLSLALLFGGDFFLRANTVRPYGLQIRTAHFSYFHERSKAPPLRVTHCAARLSLPPGGRWILRSKRRKENAAILGFPLAMERVPFFRAAGSPLYLLAAARSRSRSDTTPWCHSLRSRRFATSRRGAMLHLRETCEKAPRAASLPPGGGRSYNHTNWPPSPTGCRFVRRSPLRVSVL